MHFGGAAIGPPASGVGVGVSSSIANEKLWGCAVGRCQHDPIGPGSLGCWPAEGPVLLLLVLRLATSLASAARGTFHAASAGLFSPPYFQARIQTFPRPFTGPLLTVRAAGTSGRSSHPTLLVLPGPVVAKMGMGATS